MIRIQDLLGLSEITLSDIKIHFASGALNNRDAIDEFFKGTFQAWQELQTARNFERGHILSLAYLKPGEWLFLGLYRKTGIAEISGGFKYSTEQLQICQEFVGRLVIHYAKEFRQSYVLAEKYLEEFRICEILREPMAFVDFPGYENVRISRDELQMIVRLQDNSWETALRSVTGVYLITDGNNGKLYVGSATGEDNFWQRWSEYAKTVHGGNLGLRKLVEEEDQSYFNRFYYSILEIFRTNTEREVILARETHWKEVLKTGEFGYNSN